MVFPPASSGNLLLSLRVALISTGVLSLAVILKLSVPVVADFAVTELPVMYTSVLSWLQPPYLYLVINGIIISIVASSKLQLQFQLKNQDRQVLLSPSEVPVVAEEKISVGASDEYHGAANILVSSEYYCTFKDLGVDEKVDREQAVNIVPSVPPVAEEENFSVGLGSGDYGINDDQYLEVVEKGVVVEESGGAWEEEESKAPYRSDSMEEWIFEKGEEEKPLVSARLGRRKSLKTNSEGGGKAAALGVSKPKRLDTLESTWKTITDGRPIPLTRHLKKSDTWDTHLRRDAATATPPPKMKKSDTFNGGGRSQKLTPSPQGSGKLRREPSLGQDELNKRVEAFIKKFNEEMRLQRQESLNQYQEMIARRAY